jgi:hypothetical protein
MAACYGAGLHANHISNKHPPYSLVEEVLGHLSPAHFRTDRCVGRALFLSGRRSCKLADRRPVERRLSATGEFLRRRQDPVFAARTVRWRGIFAVHTWVVVKEKGARS